jgi:hypothetical protein
VVTHKGRSADGGHYIGWVHASGDDWMQCDDDIVTNVKTDDIMALRGGGDWHTAYLCLYRKIEVVEKAAEWTKWLCLIEIEGSLLNIFHQIFDWPLISKDASFASWVFCFSSLSLNEDKPRSSSSFSKAKYSS